MNKAQKTLAGLLGVVIAELAVVDYAAMEFLRNGFQMEVDLTEAGREGCGGGYGSRRNSNVERND